jgi:hypothetical protein
VPGRPVYSTFFALEVDSDTSSHYEVPVGFTAVVRDMRFYIPSPGFQPVDPFCRVILEDTDNVIWEIAGKHATPGVYTWIGHQVFSIVLEWEHPPYPCNLRASGYLLTNPA